MDKMTHKFDYKPYNKYGFKPIQHVPLRNILMQLTKDSYYKKEEREKAERLEKMALMREYYHNELVPKLQERAKEGYSDYFVSIVNWQERESLKEWLKSDNLEFQLKCNGIVIGW